MTVDDQIIRLPDAYAKAPDSVIYRILQLDAADRDEMRAALDRVRAWRSLDDAEGAALDMIGRDLDLPRGGMSDIEYRRRLRLRVATILSSGEIERFNEILDAFMGRAFIGLQEGWTDVPEWDYHFDGSLRFDAEDQVFDAGDPCPLGPPEPAAVIVRCDLDALYEDIQAAFDRAGTSYRAEDILASIADLVAVAAEPAAGGVRVKWFPILKAALDAISVVQVAHPHLTLGTVRSHLYDGSYAFDGSTSFDGGYTALLVEHEESLAADHQIVTAPEHRFEGLARFNGREMFDASREIAVHDPRLIIQATGDTAVMVDQAAAATNILGPTMPRFTGSLLFTGDRRFDGYTALWAAHGESLAAEHQIVTAPKHRFEGLARFNGWEQFDASREIAVHDPRLIIQVSGSTAIAAAQTATQTVDLGPTVPRFTGGLLFDGSRRFDGYTALWAEQGAVENVEHQAACGPVSRFDMGIPFTGGLKFNGLRGLVVHDVTITEVTT
jgi:hypothetical protein